MFNPSGESIVFNEIDWKVQTPATFFPHAMWHEKYGILEISFASTDIETKRCPLIAGLIHNIYVNIPISPCKKSVKLPKMVLGEVPVAGFIISLDARKAFSKHLKNKWGGWYQLQRALANLFRKKYKVTDVILVSEQAYPNFLGDYRQEFFNILRGHNLHMHIPLNP